MIVREYTIQAADGMHARPATALVRLAKKFESSIRIKKGTKQTELNSLLNILGLTLKSGDSILVLIEGPDESDAIIAIESFFTEQLKDL